MPWTQVTLCSTIGQSVSLPNTTIGCGIENVVLGLYMNASGIVALGPGATSLISRMGNSIGGKFSYCLVPTVSKLSSKLNFGGKGVVTGPTVVSTPLIVGYQDMFYLLTLEAMSIEGEKLEFHSSLDPREGNIVIDSVTTLTFLPEEFYNHLESKVSSMIHLERVQDPDQVLNLCYKTESAINAPIITVHFTGADVKLRPLNTFLCINKDVVCFAFVPFDGNNAVALYGNLAQLNFLIGYDLEKKTIF